jgi:hypothetical protein
MTKVNLYDVPRRSFIKVQCENGEAVIRFNRLDGAYSYCVTKDGGVLHLSASAPVEIVSKPEDWGDNN